MTIAASTWIVRTEGLMTASVDRDLVILNLARDHYAGLDAIGRRIWDLLVAPCRVDALCEQLSREFDGTLAQVSADVVSFLADMEREGLVHGADERPR